MENPSGRAGGSRTPLSPRSTLARNTLIQMVGKAFSVLAGIATLGVLTRFLGREGFGQYTTVIAFVQLFAIVADLGLYLVTLRTLSQPGIDQSRVFSNIFTLRIVSALLFVAAAPLAVLVLPVAPEVKFGVLLAALNILFVSENQVLLALYQKSLAMTRAVVGEVAGKLALLGLTIAAVRSTQPLRYVLLAVVAGSLVQTIVSVALAGRFARVRLRFDLDVWKLLLRESAPLAVSIVLNLIYFRSDTIILALFHPPATVGLYGASYKVLEVLIAVPAMFAGLILPPLAYHQGRGDAASFQVVFQKGFDFLVTLALPAVAGVFLLAGPIIGIIAGREFGASVALLRILVFAMGTIFLGSLFGNTVVAIGRQKAMMKVYLRVAILGLAGYLVLIPMFGAWGAAAMTVVTEAGITIGAFLIVRGETRVTLSGRQLTRVVAATLVMALGLLAVQRKSLPLAIVGGAALYVLTLRVVGGLRSDLLPEAIRQDDDAGGGTHSRP